MTNGSIHEGSCRCGAVRFEVTLPNGFQELRRCNCSICRRRGSIAASVALDGLRVTKGADKLSCYRFNTMTAEHYSCSICGIYTHHRRRSNRGQYGFNVGCLEDFDPFSLGVIPVVDGINHPCDREAL